MERNSSGSDTDTELKEILQTATEEPPAAPRAAKKVLIVKDPRAKKRSKMSENVIIPPPQAECSSGTRQIPLHSPNSANEKNKSSSSTSQQKLVLSKKMVSKQIPRHIRITRDQVLISHLNTLRKHVDDFRTFGISHLNALTKVWATITETLPISKLMGTSRETVHRMLAYSSDILAESCDGPFIKLDAQRRIDLMLTVQSDVAGQALLNYKDGIGDIEIHNLTEAASPLMARLFMKKCCIIWSLTSNQPPRWRTQNGRFIISSWNESVQDWLGRLSLANIYNFSSINHRWDWFSLAVLAQLEDASYAKVCLDAAKTKSPNEPELLESTYTDIILNSLTKQRAALLRGATNDMKAVTA